MTGIAWQHGCWACQISKRLEYLKHQSHAFLLLVENWYHNVTLRNCCFIVISEHISIQSSAVITRFNMIRYCISNCRNWGRISIRCCIEYQSDTSPWRVSYGVSFVDSFEKIDRVITAPHCICTTQMLHIPPSDQAWMIGWMTQDFRLWTALYVSLLIIMLSDMHAYVRVNYRPSLVQIMACCQGITWTNVGIFLIEPLSVWYKSKFGSQILATNFGVFFVIYVMFSEIGSMWF